MSSSYLLNLKINQLQQEIQGIGQSIGYFFNVTSTTGLTIDGSETAVNISAPRTNNTMWGASDISRSGSFSTSATTGNGYASTVMYFGISKDITQVFPGASTPSMAMCDWGLVVTNQVSEITPATMVNLIQNGVRNPTNYGISTNDRPTEASIVYDGTTLKFYGGGTEIVALRQTVELAGGYRLVCGSFYGGVLNSITWSGAGGSSGGGGNENLQMVLANGNDAGLQDILNVKDLQINGLTNILGGAIVQGAEKAVEFASATNLQFATNNGITILSAPNFPSNGLRIYEDDRLGNTIEMLNMSTDDYTFSFGNQQTADPSIPQLLLKGATSSELLNGCVIDTLSNPSVLVSAGTITGFQSKLCPFGQSISILQLDLGKENYGLFTMNVSQFSFTASVTPSQTTFPITTRIYISATPDESINSPYPLSVIHSNTQNINPQGGNPNFTAGNFVMSRANNSNGRYLYIGVFFTCTDPNPAGRSVRLQNCTFTYSLTSQASKVSLVEPTIVS